MKTARHLRRTLAAAVARFALRHLGPARPSPDKLQQALRTDWKSSTARLGLRRHTPWHDRFRRHWIRLRKHP